MSHPSDFRATDTPARPATVVTWPADRLHCEKFPYLLVFLSPPSKSIIPIVTVLTIPPGQYDWETFLVDAAELFYKLNSMPCCLVINEHMCAWFVDDCGGIRSNVPPRGGFIVAPECVGNQEVRDFVKWSEGIASGDSAAHLQLSTGPENPPGERFECWDNEEKILTIPEEDEIDVDKIAQSATRDWGINSVDGWDGKTSTLVEAVRPFAKVIDGRLKVCVATPETLECLISHILDSHTTSTSCLLDQFRKVVSLFIKVFQQAGLYQDIESALSFTSTHAAYALHLLKDALDRLHPEISLPESWRVHLNLLVPALMCSASNLLRIDTWVRAFSSLREQLDPLYADNEGLMKIEDIERFVLLGKAAFQSGAEYFFIEGDTLIVIPSPRIKFNDEDDLHCADGPAIVDLLGNADYFWNGEHVSEKLIMSPLSISNDEIAMEAIDKRRDMMISRRAEARYSLLCSGVELDPSFLFHTSTQKGGK